MNLLHTLQRILQLLGTIVTGDDGWRVNVRQIGGNAERMLDIEQAQFANLGTHLQQQRQRLANATGRAQHCNANIVLRGEKEMLFS